MTSGFFYAGERNLKTLLKSLTPSLLPGTYAFVGMPFGKPVPPGLKPLLIFHEPEGVTLILNEEELAKSALPHAFFCRAISVNAHSSLYAVGFLAAISEALAKISMSINIVSAFHRDYIFVPTSRADEAIAALRALAAQS
jgi:uncharacterized protein